MCSTLAPDEISLSPTNLVEVVPSAHGGKRAKYAGQMFRLHSIKGRRYYWRCDLCLSRRLKRRPNYSWDPDWQDVGRASRDSDLRVCESRLITDLYGDQHLVYDYRPHDDAQQRLAEERKRRAEASNKQQPRDEAQHQDAETSKKKRLFEATHKQQAGAAAAACPAKPLCRLIGHFRYVLQRRDGALQTWRCEFAECTSRCQTHHDGLILNWPSLHLEDVHAQMGRPFTKKQCCQNRGILCRVMEQRRHLQNDAEGQSSSSPSSSATANAVCDVAASRGGRKSHELAAVLVQVTGAPTPDGAPPNRARSDSGGRNQPSFPQNAKKSAGVVRDGDHSDAADQKYADGDKAEHKRDSASFDIEFDSRDAAGESSHLTADYVSHHAGGADQNGSPVSAVEVDEEWPCKSASSLLRDQDYGASSSLHARCEEVLQMMCDVGDSRDRDLRASILVHMRRLLEAETNLVKQKCRVVVMRGKVLERQLEDLVPQSTPPPLDS